MKPVICINCDYEEDGKLPYYFLYRDYTEAIIAAGGIPLLLPIIKNKNDLELFLKRIDGLLLTGGNDVPPHRYGKDQHEMTINVHPDKDASDFALIWTAIEMKKPILAICYGTQLVNVALSGSLIQDIPSEVISPIIHKDTRNDHYIHSVTIEKDSLLYKITGTERIETNSSHHQAIEKLGKSLKDTAHAVDGIIEAIEGKGYPFLLGVQWHPERMRDNLCHASLFNALINASK